MRAASLITLILAATSCLRSTRETVARCWEFPEGSRASCGVRDDGTVRVPSAMLSGFTYDERSLAILATENHGLFFVTRAGRTASAFPFDNGADYFVEGLARTVRNREVGFVNPQLDVVIAPAWDFAAPFENGYAAVCNGCVKTSLTPGDEHSAMRGGKWGYIDKKGALVVALTDERALKPPTGGAR